MDPVSAYIANLSLMLNSMAESTHEEHGTSDEFVTQSSYEGHGTSDEYVDPFCDTCYEGKGLNIKVYGYCKDCFQFMCSDCHLLHSKFPLARGHTVLRGSSMPQSQADKPPKFDYCDIHPNLLKNEFCSEHKTLVCSSCSSTNHSKCFVGSVENVCKTVNISEIDLLYNDIKTLKDQARSVHSALETNVGKLAQQKKTILKEAQAIYDSCISKINKLFKDLQSEINTTYYSQEMLISQQQERIDVLVNKLESALKELEKFKGKPIDIKLFLKTHDLVTDTRQITDELRTVNTSLRLLSLSFKPNKTVQDLLLPSVAFGSVCKSERKYDTHITVKDIVFPCSQYKLPNAGQVPSEQTSPPGLSGQQSQTARFQAQGPPVQLSKIKATKHDTHNVKLKDDRSLCFITGLAITKDRKRIVVDNNNNKVKMFSHDMQLLSSVPVADRPWDIAVITDKEAIVTTDNKSLVTLDISGSQLSIKTTTQLPYDVQGISRFIDTLVVTNPDSKSPSVKLIDQTGRVYWSVSSGQQGQPLFSEPLYVSSPGDGRSSTVIVTDASKHTLTLLNGDTGQVITRRQLKEGKYPRGVTSDPRGNVYVCYWGISEVAVLSGDLSKERILLSRQEGLSVYLQAIVYDDEAHQLIISNSSISTWDKVDAFQLS